MREDLSEWGEITTLTVDAKRKTAFVRFKTIEEAERAAAAANDTDTETGKKSSILRSPNDQALILYVIPQIA